MRVWVARVGWPKVVGLCAAALLLCGVLAVVALIAAVRLGAFGELPTRTEVAAIENHEASALFDRNGELLSRYYDQNRELVDFEDLPPVLIEALVSTEDARFFEHEGIDWVATARAVVFTGILGQREQGGGSTLSQQLAKRHFSRRGGGKFRLLIAKITEAITAGRFEEVYSKEELIGLYFNSVDFGENIYGVKLAAGRYFGVDPYELTADQAAVLVGMLKGTTSYNPVANPERSLARRNLVLRRMREQDFLTEAQYAELTAKPLGLAERRERAQARTSHFSERVKSDIATLLAGAAEEAGTEPLDLYTDGLRVYTTLDAELQRLAEAALQETLAELQPAFAAQYAKRDPDGDFAALLQAGIEQSARYRRLRASGLSSEEAAARFGESRTLTFAPTAALGGGERVSSYRDSVRAELLRLRAGFVVADAYTEEMLAYVGGEDYSVVPFNSASAKRQVGSTFKPIVYAAALEQNVSPCDYYPNELRTYADYDDWAPENSGGEYGGEYSVVGGLVGSVNTVAVQLVFEAGVQRVQELARSLGLRDVPAEPSIALGTPSLTLEEMARVYGAFAHRGLLPEYAYVLRIEDRDGEVLYERNEPVSNPRVVSRHTAEVMDYALRQVARRGTGAGLYGRYGVQSDVAGKTGTTQDQADGWFMGYTRDLVVGAWVGGQYPSIRWRSLARGQGARTALPIVGRFLRAYERARGVTRLPELPDDVLLDADCADFIDEVPLDTVAANPFAATLEEILRRRREDREARRRDSGSEVRAGAAERNRARQRAREERNRVAAERRRERQRAAKQRDRERARADRRERRRKAIERIFGNPD